MSLVPYALARRFLFSLDPETAHELTLHALAGTQGTPLQMAYVGAVYCAHWGLNMDTMMAPKPTMPPALDAVSAAIAVAAFPLKICA